jgi:hypothetical protein
MFQVAPRLAMLAVGRELVGGATIDFAAGVELILVSDLDRIDPADALVLSDNQMADNPLTGEPVLMKKFPASGGFIPWGHCRADGSHHPHAGTGFLVLVKHGVPQRVLRGEVDGASGAWVTDPDVLRQFEVHQLAFDPQARRVKVTSSQTLGFKDLLAGHTLFNRGLGAAIPDGDDLLFTMQGGGAELDDRQWATSVGAGCMRWRRGDDGQWRPSDFHPILGAITGYETSMVRDHDGSLLATARQTGKHVAEKFNLLLWRSVDGGRSWTLILDRPRARADSPIALGRACDGTIFFVGNLLTAPFAGRGKLGYWREVSALWPLRPDRLEFDPLWIHRCASLEWGPPCSDRGWNVDHLLSSRLQLGDGRWRTLLTYRAMDRGETAYGQAPTPHTGFYVDEVTSRGEALPGPWNF